MLKFFVEIIYLLKMLMDQVDTLHVGRYWSLIYTHNLNQRQSAVFITKSRVDVVLIAAVSSHYLLLHFNYTPLGGQTL